MPPLPVCTAGQKELDLYGKGLATKSTHLARCVHPPLTGGRTAEYGTVGIATTILFASEYPALLLLVEPIAVYDR